MRKSPAGRLEDRSAPRGARFIAAAGEAAIAALLVLGLSFPILAYRTEAGLSQELVLHDRRPLALLAAAIAFAVRFLVLVLPRPRKCVPAVRLRHWVGAWAGILAPLAGPATIGLLVAFPLLALRFFGPAGALKWIDNYGVQILLYVLLGFGLDVVVGLAGLLDLGYVAFYAVGAYSYALLSTHWGWSFWACFPIAGMLAGLWGAMLGFPVLRLRGDYLAIVTLAFGEIIRIVLTNWTDLTNGEAGIGQIPRITFFGWPFVAGPNGFAAHVGLAHAPIHRVIFLFYILLALVLLVHVSIGTLRRSPIGRAFEALREDEIACRSLGINTVTIKLAAFALGAVIAGLAGAVFAARQGFVSPSSFTFIESATILAIVVLGGGGSHRGVVLATLLLVGGAELLRELDVLRRLFGPTFDATQYRMLVVGLVMVVIMNLRPRGFGGAREPSVLFRARRPPKRASTDAGIA